MFRRKFRGKIFSI